MRAKIVPFAAVAAVACLLGTAEAIKCYSCIYADDFSGPIPPSFEPNAPPQNERCGRTIGDGLNPTTHPNETNIPFLAGFNVPGAMKIGSEEAKKIQELAKFFQAPETETTGIKAGAPYKVYCAKLSGDIGGEIGYITMRGVAASDNLVVYDGCTENRGMDVCTCSEDECNSASGIQLSFGLIAITLFGKFFF